MTSAALPFAEWQTQFLPTLRLFEYAGEYILVDVVVPTVVRLRSDLGRLFKSVLEQRDVGNASPQLLADAEHLLRTMKDRANETISNLETAAAKRRISSYRLVLTERCNLRCTYCFIPKYSDRMSSDVLRNTLQKLLRLGEGYPIEELQFFGGEPLTAFGMIKDAVHYLEEHKHLHSIPSIKYTTTTNGTFCTAPIVEFLREHAFSVDISIDGDEITNDAQRGKGTYRQAVLAYTSMRLAGIDVGFILTPTVLSFRQLPKFVSYLIECFSPLSITINSPQPTADGWGLPGKEFARIILECIDVCKQRDTRLTSPADRQLAAFKHLRPYTNACTRFSDSYGMLIDTEGNFRICDVDWTLPEFIVPDERLTDGRTLMDLKTNGGTPPAKCQSCIAYAGCGGPCPLERALNDKDHITNTNRCEFNETLATIALSGYAMRSHADLQ